MPADTIAGTVRIAIIGTRGLPARYGGFETLADRLSTGLVAHGHEVVVYGRTGYAQPARVEIQPRLWAVRVPTISWVGAESISAGAMAMLHSKIRFKPDIALVCNPANVWAAEVLQGMGIPCVLHLAGLEHARSQWRGLGSSVLRHAIKRAVESDLHLLTDSNAIARWYQRNLQREPSVIAYGSEAQVLNQTHLDLYGLKPGAYDLIVARLEEDNHIAEIVRAHGQTEKPRRLVIVGEPRQQNEYTEQIIKAINEHKRALRLGSIWDTAVLSSLWAGARCYIHGHSTGGTNPALLSGAASGAEVLVHDNPYNVEVVGEHGWAWQNEEALTELLNTQPWQTAPRHEALKAATLERYKWSEIVAEYETLFREVLADRAANR